MVVRIYGGSKGSKKEEEIASRWCELAIAVVVAVAVSAQQRSKDTKVNEATWPKDAFSRG